MTQPTALADFFAALRPQIRGELRTDAYNRMLYSTDASIYQVMPHGVLLPAHTDDVEAAVSLAAQYQIPVLGRTGGSSLAGQAVNEALVIDFTRHLDQILEINAEERWVRVQPGVVLDALNGALRPYQLQFGPDPASGNRAAMGGIVSNNATGAHSILYGMSVDHVQSVRAILDDGSAAAFGPLSEAQLAQRRQENGRTGAIYRHLHALTQDAANQEIVRTHTPRHWRRCGGYNLDRLIPANGGVNYHRPPDPRCNVANLFAGAEGTLGVLTEITLNLVPRPQRTALAIVQFADLHHALTAVPTLLEANPSAIELLDHLQLTLCRNAPEYARLLATFIEGDPFCLLITEFYGESEAELRHKIDNYVQHIKRQGVPATGVTPLLDPIRQQNVWTVRKGGLGLLMSMRGDYKPIAFIEDSAVPVAHLDEYVTKLETFCAELDTRIAYYAHASAGCLHIRPIVDAKKAAEIAKLPQIARFAVDLLRGYGGAWSSEHGDGRSRSWLNPYFFGPDLYGLYREVKQIFDPHNLFNPGNIVQAGDMTANLRYGGAYEVIPLQTRLDFSADHGFDRAIEMCNGAGVCRKRSSGAMCPSFMATREEEHSTRGRANALRAALSGLLPPEELTSPRMHDVMALCVSCKACKAECPSSVDMAKIKTEFLAQYQAVHGTPLRSRLFAHIDALSRLSAGPLAPLANGSLRLPPLRWGMERWLGISRERPLPLFARTPFTRWFAARQRSQAATRGQVVLFNDTFNTYNYPQIAMAATELLEAAGFEVVLPGVTDCGRPAFSKGLVEPARQAARRALRVLHPFALRGTPIVFLEPSELSMVRDDFTALRPHDERVGAVAAVSVSLEQFVADLADAGALNLAFTTQPRQLLLHGHCHQKALFGTKAAHRALTLPAHYTLTELDTSCCGMAGSFGFEAEHVDVSMQMGELKLLPAVRDAAAGTIIVAAGVSCRQQIAHGAGRRALHPAQVLREALAT